VCRLVVVCVQAAYLGRGFGVWIRIRLVEAGLVWFGLGDDASIFFSGPVDAEGGASVAAPAGWLFWNLMVHPLTPW
jgi:hypothetical protein